MEGERWRLRPAFFGVALLCFFLPFMTVSCRGQEVASVTGMQLVTGFTVDNSGTTSSSVSSQSAGDRQGSEPLAVLALAAVVAGLVISFVNNRLGGFGAIAAGVVGAFALVRLKSKIDAQVLNQGAGLFQVNYQVAFYGVLLLCLIAAGVNAYLVFATNVLADTGAAPVAGRTAQGPPDG